LAKPQLELFTHADAVPGCKYLKTSEKPTQLEGDSMAPKIWHSGCIKTRRVNDGQPQTAVRKQRQKQHGGFSLIELLIVVAIILIIASIAIPSLIQSKIVANEAAAVGTLSTIRSAQAAYIASYPEAGFADSLDKLGPPTGSTGPSELHAGLVDEVLALKHVKNGYNYAINGVKPEQSTTVNGYAAMANPQSATTGKRNFCMNESGVIRAQSGGTACDPATSTPVQ
jgi:prepilin-type N-terminal cleavage/methylation domain-containing protein